MAPTVKAAKHAEQVVDASVEIWDSYVSEIGRADGEYVGSGVRGLRLSGAPENGATWSLMNGINPVTGERFHTPYWTKVAARWREGKKLVSAPSYAAVFSAPKTVSLLTVTGYREAALSAHRAAVAEAMRFIESEWFVRDRLGQHASLGVVATSYEHHTSRLLVPEPHLHTHVTLMNFAQRAFDGKWLAVDYKHFLRLQKAAGIVYQAALRREIALRIPGVAFELAEDGTAEIAQIPKEAREAFSTRHAQIVERERELLAEGIAKGYGRQDKAAFETRSKKHKLLDPADWMVAQRERLADLEITEQSIAAWADQGHVVQASWEVRRQALADRLFGSRGLTEQRNSFNRWDVMEEVGIAHYTDMSSFELLVQRTDELLADARVVAVGEQGRYSVRELLQLEESVLQSHRTVPAAAAPPDRRALISSRIASSESEQGWQFNEEQRVMIEGLATSARQVEVVEALAGTGKTRSMGMLAEILDADGVRVIGVAPTGRARLELMRTAGMKESYTLAGLKLRLERGDLVLDSRRPCVLLVDEAGFSATRELAPVIARVTAAGGRVVLVGDSGQLASVGAGGLFTAISNERVIAGAGVYRLARVMRHRTADGRVDHAEVRALAALRHGEPEAWVALRETRGQMHVHSGTDAGMRGMEHAAELYLQALDEHAAKDVYLLAASNAVRDTLNNMVRERLIEREAIVEAGWINGRSFAKGERITLRRNDNAEDLANGMRATVLKVDVASGSLMVAIDGEDAGIQELGYEYVTGETENGVPFVQGGYANTIHTAQGGTVAVTITAGAAQDFKKEHGYVAASRHMYATHFVTWDGSLPEWFAEDELTKQEEHQEVREQLLDALQRVGREPAATEQIAEAAADVSLTPARDEFLKAVEILSSVGKELGEPWAAQAIKTRKLVEMAASVRAHAEAEASEPEPAVWERTERQLRKHRLKQAQDALDAADLREREAREQLRQFGDPDELMSRHAQLEHDRATWASGLDLREAAFMEEINRQPAYLTQALGPQPTDANSLRRWTTAANKLMLHRWDRGILHDESATLSSDVEPSVRQYQQRTREHGQDLGKGM